MTNTDMFNEIKLGDPGEKIMEEPSQLSDFEAWLDYCTKEKEYYLDWGSPLMNEALRGARGGMSILIGGLPNFGKSIYLTSTTLKILENNDNLVVVDFSLDDPKSKRITQYVASLSRLEMNTVDFANQIEDIVSREKFEVACNMIKNWIKNNNLYIYENSSGTTDIVNQAEIKFISDSITKLRDKHPDKKLVVIIDSLNDIEAANISRNDDPLVKSEGITKQLNRCIVRNDALLLATTHLRKNGGRRPTLEDLKGNNFLAYSAKAAIGIHNEMKLLDTKAKVYWEYLKKDNITRVRMPVVEAHFIKSKVSAFNGTIFFKQWPARGRVEEGEPELQKRLREIIYESM